MMNKDDLIQKWLNETLTDTERQAFSKLGDADFNQYIIENAKYFKAPELLEGANFDAFKDAYYATKKPVKKLNWISPLLKIASVFVIGLGIYFTFIFSNSTHIETLASQKSTVELPDQSIVELNALSSIDYNAKKWNEHRELTLDGEAYFKVSKGNVFDVKTTIGLVKVVGTQFNVKQRYNYFEVVCFEGVVEVTSNSITRKLLAGDTYQILNGKFSEGKTNALAPEWIHNISEFKRIPFKEVLSELERQYNIQISYENVDANRLFTGSFPHDNIENGLIAITQPMNLTYKFKSSNLVVIYGK